MSVSEKGQATIPKRLREKHGIDTPGKVRVRENEDGEIVVEPVPGLLEMRGAASDEWRGTELLREGRTADERRDDRLGRDERFDRGERFGRDERLGRDERFDRDEDDDR